MIKNKTQDIISPPIHDLGIIPFIIGTSDTPDNPHGLPNTLPFSYLVDPHTNVLRQNYAADIEQHLTTAYEQESMLGTPMDMEGEGSRYLFDFFDFITKTIPNLKEKNTLEIGCGRGCLLNLLQKEGANVTGIEPGKRLKNYWDKNNVTVINGFFPSPQLNNTFDLIVAYGVLEHIYDAEKFVQAISNQISENGKIILAVPNCEQQIENCDPSLFLHEHYSYFSKESLSYFLEVLGFKVNLVTHAGYGGSIYICAQRSNTPPQPQNKSNKFDLDNFANNVNNFTAYIKEEIKLLNKENNSLGVYCPGRALGSIPLNAQYRFFDDDDNIHKQYFPPFSFPIENRQELIDNPVDVLWIFSYSFGDKIKNELRKIPQLSQTKIITLDELKNK